VYPACGMDKRSLRRRKFMVFTSAPPLKLGTTPLVLILLIYNNCKIPKWKVIMVKWKIIKRNGQS